jgi:ribonuclease Z
MQTQQHIEAHGYHIDAFRVNHKITCYGYSISIPRAGLFDVEKAKANDVPLKYWNRLQKGESIEAEGKIYEPSMVLGEPRKGIKVTYTTDTRPTDSIRENAKDADLFICEGMYGERGDINNAVKYKHMTFEEAAGLAKDAGVQELWLTHYSPAINHPEVFMEDVRRIFPNAHAAKDRRSMELNFEE